MTLIDWYNWESEMRYQKESVWRFSIAYCVSEWIEWLRVWLELCILRCKSWLTYYIFIRCKFVVAKCFKSIEISWNNKASEIERHQSLPKSYYSLNRIKYASIEFSCRIWMSSLSFVKIEYHFASYNCNQWHKMWWICIVRRLLVSDIF